MAAFFVVRTGRGSIGRMYNERAMIDLGSETTPLQAKEFLRLCTLEPHLATIYADACAVKDDGGPSFCANAIFYGFFGNNPGFKSRLSQLVGDRATREELKNSECYDLVYEVIYNVLPDCRNCMCG